MKSNAHTHDHTYPLIDVHLERLVVVREEIWIWAASHIAQVMLKSGTQTHKRSCAHFILIHVERICLYLINKHQLH